MNEPTVTVSNSQIRDWLDLQVKAYKDASTRLVVNDAEDYLSNISIHGEGIHLMSDDLRFVAEKLKLELCVSARKGDSDYPYKVFFIYEGTVFFDIESEGAYQIYGAVV